MKEKKLVVVMYDRAVKHYSENELETPFERDVCSHLSMIKGLQKYFYHEDVGFATPDSILEDDGIYTIEKNRFRKTSQPLSAETLVIFSVNNCSPRFCQDYVKRQIEAYQSLENRVGEIINPVESWDKVDKKKVYSFGKEHFPELLESSSWESVEGEVRQRGEAVLKHRSGAGGAEVFLLTPENFGDIRSRFNGTLEEYVLQKRLHPKNEKRLYLMGGEIQAALINTGLRMPWDGGNIWNSITNYARQSYLPSIRETRTALNLYEHLGVEFAAIDFFDTEDGTLIVEANIISPGLVGHTCLSENPVYDLGERFASFLYERHKTQIRSKPPIGIAEVGSIAMP